MIHDRTYAVEIECIGPEHGVVSHTALAEAITDMGVPCVYAGYSHLMQSKWKVVTDRSVTWPDQGSQLGFEVNSPAPPKALRGTDGFGQIAAVCAALAAKRMRINATCGLHVHVDAKQPLLDLAALKRLALLYAQSEALIDMLMPHERKGDNAAYCRSITNINPAAIQVVHSPEQLALVLGRGARVSRNVKLNFGSLDRYGTVEFRHHSGTIEAHKIKPWVRMCLALVDHAANVPEGDGAITPQTTQRIIEQVRTGTKIAIIYDMLTRSQGATMPEITAATISPDCPAGWTNVSVPRFCQTYGLSLRTIKGWEAGSRKRINRYFAAPAVRGAATMLGNIQQRRQTTAAPRSLAEMLVMLNVPEDERTYWNERAAKFAVAAADLTIGATP